MGGLSLDPTAIAAFIPFIGILIFVHELGHFLAAKYFDIKVLKFSLGFGPALFRFTRGETTYQIALLPLGGYVKMLGDTPGDDVSEADKARAFSTAPVHQRAVVALAGPVFNLVLPVICFFAYYLLGPTLYSPVIGHVEVGSPAEKAGLKASDRVLSIDGNRVWDFTRMLQLTSKRAGQPMQLEIDRDGQKLAIAVTPTEIREEDSFGGKRTRGVIGVSQAQLSTRIGVETPAALALGFRTGDRIVRIGGHPVAEMRTLRAHLQESAGKRTTFDLLRPVPRALGGLLVAELTDVVSLEVDVPAGAKGIEDLGLEPSEMYLRALVPGGVAEGAGLAPGDRIVEVGGRRVSSFYFALRALRDAEGKPVPVTVSRLGERRTVTLTAEKKEVHHDLSGKTRPYFDFGLGHGELPRLELLGHWSPGGRHQTERVHLGLGEALLTSVEDTLGVIGEITTAVYKLFARDISVKNLGGPIMLYQVASYAAELGIFAYLRLLALISVNLGIINLLPVPVFDGGHLLFCAIEAIKRKPVSLRAREAATIVGLAMLLVLGMLVMFNDITRLSE